MAETRVLFISMGMTQAVVPEAFLLPGVSFDEVHVLTSVSTSVSSVQAFFLEQAPHVKLTISRVAGFRDFVSERDHFQFEEVLYRWLLHYRPRSNAETYFCLSGGFKTMSAAVQKAATLFGVKGLFHVLADQLKVNGKTRYPESINEILEAAEKGHLHWIELGGELGWPQLRHLGATDYPVSMEEGAEEGVDVVSVDGWQLRQHVRQLEELSQRILGSWHNISELPFPDLATWSAQDLAWLQAPIDLESETDRDWIDRLPKVELHCHLGGFATRGPLLNEVRGAAENPGDLPSLLPLKLPEDWPLPRKPVGLNPYREFGDNNGSVLLKDPGCLRRQCELLYDHFVSQNILYAEVRCSPGNYASEERSPWDVVEAIRTAFQRCMTEGQTEGQPSCHVKLIIIGTRQTGGDYRAGISRHLGLAVTAAEHWTRSGTCRVVGVDLAGFEDPSTRAHLFREEFTAVHRCGLALTVHAGENDDAEGIWRAVFDLNARRLGHALSLAQSPELLRSVVDRGIGIEMCPYANLQIRGFPFPFSDKKVEDQACYPLSYYLDAGARVTVNTDNIGISAANLSDNLRLAVRLNPGLKRLDLLRLQQHSLEVSFLTSAERRDLKNRFSKAIPLP